MRPHRSRRRGCCSCCKGARCTSPFMCRRGGCLEARGRCDCGVGCCTCGCDARCVLRVERGRADVSGRGWVCVSLKLPSVGAWLSLPPRAQGVCTLDSSGEGHACRCPVCAGGVGAPHALLGASEMIPRRLCLVYFVQGFRIPRSIHFTPKGDTEGSSVILEPEAHLARPLRPTLAPFLPPSLKPVAVDTLAAAPELLCRDFDLRACQHLLHSKISHKIGVFLVVGRDCRAGILAVHHDFDA